MTTFIKTETLEYPVHEFMIRRDNPGTSFGPVITEMAAAHLGYQPVVETTPPEGDVVTELVPKLVGGVYVQDWATRDFNEEEINQSLMAAKSSMLSAITNLTQDALVAGTPFNFGTEETPDVARVAMSDGDRVNVIGLKQAADREIARGTNNPVFIRCVDNSIKSMTPEKAIEMSWAVYDGYTAVMSASWTLQHQVEVAGTKSQLPVLPTSLV